MFPSSQRTPDRSARLTVLRAAINARLNLPAQILIASSTNRDGVQGLTAELAESFAADALRTVSVRLVSATSGFSVERRRLGASLTSFDILHGPAAAAPFEGLLRELRDTFDVVLIAAPAVLDRGVALNVAGLVDGVLIAVAAGRSIHTADLELSPALAGVGATVIGAVMTRLRNNNQTSEVLRRSQPAPDQRLEVMGRINAGARF